MKVLRYASAAPDEQARAIQQLLDRQVIAEVILRYCRGVDRGDWDSVRECYWPDAREEHHKYVGDLDGFIEYASARVGGHDGSHTVLNMLIDLESDTVARVETVVRGYEYMRREDLSPTLDVEDTDGWIDFEVGGRYLDKFERRDGEWRIADRVLVIDWNSCRPSGSLWDHGVYDQLRHRGGVHPDDPVYTVLPALGH